MLKHTALLLSLISVSLYGMEEENTRQILFQNGTNQNIEYLHVGKVPSGERVLTVSIAPNALCTITAPTCSLLFELHSGAKVRCCKLFGQNNPATLKWDGNDFLRVKTPSELSPIEQAYIAEHVRIASKIPGGLGRGVSNISENDCGSTQPWASQTEK